MLERLPQAVFDLVIEFGIGPLSYAEDNIRRPFLKEGQESRPRMIRSGIWWASDPGYHHLPANAFAIHWMAICHPLILTSRSTRRAVTETTNFQRLLEIASIAVWEYHRLERLASFMAWFNERKAQINECGHDLLITVDYIIEPDPEDSYDEGMMEDQEDVMSEFPELDMTNKKFYCSANNPIHNDRHYDYLRACKIANQMNNGYQCFLPNTYRCRFCQP